MNILLDFILHAQKHTRFTSKYVSYSVNYCKIGGYVTQNLFRNYNSLFYCRNYSTSGYSYNKFENSIDITNVDKLQYSEEDELVNRFDAIRDKIIFNSVLERSKLNWMQKKILKDKESRSKSNVRKETHPFEDIPITLQYLNLPDIDLSNTQENEKKTSDSVNEIFCLPYTVQTGIKEDKCVSTEPMENVSEVQLDIKSEYGFEELPVSSNKGSGTHYNWMSDYEYYDESEEESVCNNRPWELNYGTPDINIPSSSVPCGGCGAILHCRDTAIPGYIPSEIFNQQDETSLRSIVCQRCHFLRNYNTALNVIVPSDEYPKIMSHIKDKVAIIILMVDLMDFPCSLWHGIMDIIGKQQPIILVGNKVDLLPPDSTGYLNRVKECLVENMSQCGIPTRNIKHVALVSASTGYGVEELITKLHNIWQYKGDVYLLGCTNVGKSTLFNALLQSDLCKVKAVDLVQRATTSPWPGTTLNLLKFPILRPEGWRLYERTLRLKSERHQIQAQNKLHSMQLKESTRRHIPALIGHVGMTFYEKQAETAKDPFSMGRSTKAQVPFSGLDPSDEGFAKSKWCYDTPGAVHPEQVIHLLTTEELLLTLPKYILVPRTFRMAPKMTIFIAGLGRLDFIEGYSPIRVTVFSSQKLPITMCMAEDADEVYRELLGSRLMGVPSGGTARLEQWPGLQAHPQLLQVEGIDYKHSCGDILLSSAGWIALSPGAGRKCTFQGWTPNGRGVYLRKPSILPFAVNLCGHKKRRSPVYKYGKGVFVK